MLLMWKLYTVSIVSLILLQYSVVLVDGVNNDENFYFANSNNKFLYKQKEDCENNFYFDFDYFQCRLCDLNFNLRPSGQRDECICSENSTEIITYDNILKRPVCEKDANASKKFKSLCSFYTVNATAFSTLRKAVRIYPKPQNQNCSCDEKLNENYHGEYCIKKELFKDYKNYENYEYLPLTKSLNLRYELKFVVFFCKVLHIRSQCNFLANLCVLTLFDIKKNGPCYPFFSQQNQQKGLFPDQNINEGNEYDGGEKIKPFLFFNNERSSERSSETLDLSFETLDQSNNTLNFTLVSYNLEGTLVEMRPFKLSDLNLCQLSPPVNIWQSKVQFGRNFFNKCTINLREIYKLGFLKTKFISIFLNFYKNQENILKNVPVLIRSPSTVNQNAETNEWQLIKRFFLIDTISGRQLKPDGKNSSTKVNNAPSESSFNKEFSQIIFAKNIELQFHIKENAEVETDRRNVIKMPTLIIEYGVLNITERSNRYKNSSSIDNVDDYLYNVETSFKITFIKRPNLNVFFQIILPILLSMSLICALFQTYFWKIRQQKIEYDLRTLMNFLINLLATISNSLFIFVALITSYILFLYKTQHKRIFLMLPLKKEEEIVGLLLSIALIFKIIKLMKIFCDIAGFDIFFIDFERPKYHAENIFNTSMPKSHPGTPSIASSIKPMISSPSQSNECVSAWRNYFIANEWQELMTKRKISIHLHVVFVITTLMVC
ncbi:CLUMA_CG012807, isoform A [Clunio marinus]|uniref:CLUMA_CG012807, isoform A n=1 Tax=Clunio marinus TaxID=568069 RepID=A0A1J1IH06_9DIPT|nr:CLUMA_CG012807, isoform A [Clunio marinus]